MSKNNPAPRFFASCPPIGGQAVIDGVMLRNGPVYGLAVRQPDGHICAQCFPWRTFLANSFLRLPFVRGFPILLETLANGINALNRSAELAEAGAAEARSSREAALSVALALLLAIGLFVAVPHLLSLLMFHLGVGGDVEGLSFHIWDGFFKCAIFLLYIWLISFVPDIHRVFQYHGAEHKIIHAWETGRDVDLKSASAMSRLHPRCGTTFLLFVIVLSIVLQAALVPPLLEWLAPGGPVSKHVISVIIKILLVLPISAAAYELIRYASALPDGPIASALRAPGLLLQKLTTREPDPGQLEVAMVALSIVLDSEDSSRVAAAPFGRLDSGFDL